MISDKAEHSDQFLQHITIAAERCNDHGQQTCPSYAVMVSKWWKLR